MDRGLATPPGRGRSKAGGRSARARPAQGTAGSVRRTRRRRLADRSDHGQRAPERHARARAQGGRDLRPVSRAPRRIFRGVGAGAVALEHACRSPLARGLYRADGQMLDEVYNYGSFKQSRMFAAGVTCSDCHEPHAASSARPATASACNATPPTNMPRWHITAMHGGPGAACASCHMPARTYMVVDIRHDHSFRIPRPDLSVTLGTPNACNDCHRDQSATGRRRRSKPGTGQNEGLSALRRGVPRRADGPGGCGRAAGGRSGGRNTPAIARATALSELGAHPSSPIIPLARGHLQIPIRWCGSAHSTCSETFRRAALAACFAAFVRFHPRGAHPGRLAARRGSDGEPAARRPASLRACGGRVHCRPAPQRRSAGSALRARTFYARRGLSGCRGGIQGRAAAEPGIRRRRSISPISTGSSGGIQGESMLRAAIAASPRTRACIMRSAGAHPPQAARRGARRAQHAAELEPERARYAYVYAVALIRPAGQRRHDRSEREPGAPSRRPRNPARTCQVQP